MVMLNIFFLEPSDKIGQIQIAQKIWSNNFSLNEASSWSFKKSFFILKLLNNIPFSNENVFN